MAQRKLLGNIEREAACFGWTDNSPRFRWWHVDALSLVHHHFFLLLLFYQRQM